MGGCRAFPPLHLLGSLPLPTVSTHLPSDRSSRNPKLHFPPPSFQDSFTLFGVSFLSKAQHWVLFQKLYPLIYKFHNHKYCSACKSIMKQIQNSRIPSTVSSWEYGNYAQEIKTSTHRKTTSTVPKQPGLKTCPMGANFAYFFIFQNLFSLYLKAQRDKQKPPIHWFTPPMSLRARLQLGAQNAQMGERTKIPCGQLLPHPVRISRKLAQKEMLMPR